MEPDYLLVPLVGARPYAAAVGVVQPPIQILTDAHVLSVERVPACAVGERLSQLVGCLFACLAVERPALWTIRCMCRVLRLPTPIFTPRDRALSVASPTHRYLLSSVREARRPTRRPTCE